MKEERKNSLLMKEWLSLLSTFTPFGSQRHKQEGSLNGAWTMGGRSVLEFSVIKPLNSTELWKPVVQEGTWTAAQPSHMLRLRVKVAEGNWRGRENAWSAWSHSVDAIGQATATSRL